MKWRNSANVSDGGGAQCEKRNSYVCRAACPSACRRKFIAVFGGAAIFFGWFIYSSRWGDSDDEPFAEAYLRTRIFALPGAIATVAFVGFVLSFWQ